ncbi:hypothetical protein BGZ79_010836, partial [Entomortierella chlamydospora]
MTRFPTKRHVYGRSMALISLIVSICLTGLPTLLGKIYPLHIIYIPYYNYQYSLDPQSLQLARVEIDQTDVLSLVNLFGIPSSNTIFYNFSVAPPPTAKSCTHSNKLDDYYGGITMTCFDDAVVDIGVVSPSIPVMTYDPMAQTRTPLLTTYNNTNYYYFNMSIGIPSIGNIYDNISPVNLPGASEIIGALRSVEGCGANIGNGRQCVRNTLGYVAVDGKGVLIVKKKFIYQLAAYDHISMGSLNCTTIVTKTLHKMCQLMENENQSYDNIIGYQSLTNTNQGARWDVLWRALDIRGYRMFAVSLDISITAYSGTPNLTGLGNCSTTSCARSQEIFEATKIYTNDNYQDNGSWADWDFSQQAIDNMTGVLLQGSFLFNGATTLTRGELLAVIPDLHLYITAGIILLLSLLGYLAGHGVEPTMGLEFSEILAAMVVKPPKIPRFWHRKDVATMTLKRPLPYQKGSQENRMLPEIMVDDLDLAVDGSEIRLMDMGVLRDITRVMDVQDGDK